MLTPYAALLLKPTATDDEVRARFHELAKDHHPDRYALNATDGVPGPLWHALVAAYTQVKTQTARSTWERQEALKAHRCTACRGQGVTGGKLSGGVKICPACQGEGRAHATAKPVGTTQSSRRKSRL
jgi:DnaJ-class molecular chaperone